MATFGNSNIASLRDVAYDLRGQTLTVRVPNSTTIDYDTGNISNLYEDTVVSKALIGPTIKLQGSDKRRTVRVRKSDVATIQLNAVVVISGTTWQIKSIENDSTDYAHHLVLETS